MKTGKLKEVTGKKLKEWWEWLALNQGGCCSIHFASTDKYRYCVCMGWLPGYGPASEEKWFAKDRKLRQAFCPPVPPSEEDEGWRICWKIGRQTHNNILQCDYDVDFEMPYITEAMAEADPELVEGDVDNTNEPVILKRGKAVIEGTGEDWDVEAVELGAPVGYRSWEDFAKYVRRIARRVWRDWRDYDD